MKPYNNPIKPFSPVSPSTYNNDPLKPNNNNNNDPIVVNKPQKPVKKPKKPAKKRKKPVKKPRKKKAPLLPKIYIRIIREKTVEKKTSK